MGGRRARPECVRRGMLGKAVKGGTKPGDGDIGGNSKLYRCRNEQAACRSLHPAERAKRVALMGRARGNLAAVVRRGSGYRDAMRGDQMHMRRSQQELRQQNERG
jgi:hypothetical protein